MDTFIIQTAYADSGDALTQNNEMIRRLEGEMSRTIETSDVCRANAAPGQDTEVSEETAEVLAAALDAAEDTGGAFSPASSLDGALVRRVRMFPAKQSLRPRSIRRITAR